jgi:nucleoside 2-deoxyribosyltransferase
LFPLDNPVDPTAPDAARQIYFGNRRLMDEADAIIANLTPFRGPSADAGTVYELGYMIGRGKHALGYTNDPSSYLDRVATLAPLRADAQGRPCDADGLIVEDFGGADNLMITEGLATGGLALVVVTAPTVDPLRDLSGFESCLKLLMASVR